MSRESSLLLVERQLLHTALVRPSSLVEMPLQSAHFTTEAYGELWGYIARENESAEADFVTVGDAAERDGRKHIGALAIEIACDSSMFTLSAPGPKCALVVSGWRSREARRIAMDLAEAAARREDGAIDGAVAALMALHAEDRECEHTAKSAMAAAWRQVEAAKAAGGVLVGIPTGLSDLDESLGGLHDSDLIVIGARPAMGKTGLLLGMTLAGSAGGPVGLISGEQPHEQVGLRWMSTGGVSVGKLRAGKVGDDWSGLYAKVKEVSERNVRILDRSSPDIAEVMRVARRWKHQHGIRALYVDYLQKLEISGMGAAPKHERVGAVAKALKNLARDLRIPVVALAQVSRKVEERANQRPMMSDLADSSEIEKEADQIMTLWRDQSNPNAEFAPAEVNVVKNRHGNTGTVNCLWRGATTSFVNLDRNA
jgi:replicative DNA helicase